MLILKNFRMKYRREIFVLSKILFSALSAITLLFLIAVVFDIFIPKDNYILKHLDDFHKFNDSVLLQFNAAIILILTIVLIIGGWRQIHNANRISKDDILLRIDYRYTSLEIIKARSIIHRLYVKFEDGKTSREDKIINTSAKIEAMRTSNIIRERSEFMYLINFLDFLETIALFYNKGSIDETDLEILSGDSMKFYRDIFGCFIENRRKSTSNRSYYLQLDRCLDHLNGV